MIPDEIRAVKIPFKESEVMAGMSKDSVMWAIKTQQLVLLRELTAQIAELKSEVRLLCQVIEGK
jgi:hypothetical protein